MIPATRRLLWYSMSKRDAEIYRDDFREKYDPEAFDEVVDRNLLNAEYESVLLTEEIVEAARDPDRVVLTDDDLYSGMDEVTNDFDPVSIWTLTKELVLERTIVINDHTPRTRGDKFYIFKINAE